jgi:hypothetical protein
MTQSPTPIDPNNPFTRDLRRSLAGTPRAPMKEPAKMTDEEIEAAKDDIRTRCGIALFSPKHPSHREALEPLPEILPSVVVPEAYYQDAPLLAP